MTNPTGGKKRNERLIMLREEQKWPAIIAGSVRRGNCTYANDYDYRRCFVSFRAACRRQWADKSAGDNVATLMIKTFPSLLVCHCTWSIAGSAGFGLFVCPIVFHLGLSDTTPAARDGASIVINLMNRRGRPRDRSNFSSVIGRTQDGDVNN